MSRFLVPMLLGALLAAQLVSLVPAYMRSKVRLLEAVYSLPEKSLQRGPVQILGAAELGRILEDAAKRRGAVPAPARPMFEETSRLVVARFALTNGDARAVAVAFGEGLASASKDTAAPITLLEVRERRAPWLRPVDLLAAAVNFGAIVVWFRRRGRMARESAG